MVPEVACKLRIVAVEALKIDVVMFVDCRLVIVPEVACKELIVPVDTFRSEVFITEACTVPIVPVEAFKTEVFVFETNTLFIKLFTHAVVGILEELSLTDKEELIVGFVKKVAADTFKTETFPVTTCNKVIVAFDVFIPKIDVKEFVIKLFTQAVVGMVEELSLMFKEELIVGFVKKVAVDASKTETFA